MDDRFSIDEYARKRFAIQSCLGPHFTPQAFQDSNSACEPNPPTPAALYARVSSDRQDVDLLDDRPDGGAAGLRQKNGYIFAHEYSDEAESGHIADRPLLRRMSEERGCQNVPFEVILLWKFSRFTRNREHDVAYKSMLRRKGVKMSPSPSTPPTSQQVSPGGHQRERGRILQ